MVAFPEDTQFFIIFYKERGELKEKSVHKFDINMEGRDALEFLGDFWTKLLDVRKVFQGNVKIKVKS